MRILFMHVRHRAHPYKGLCVRAHTPQVRICAHAHCAPWSEGIGPQFGCAHGSTATGPEPPKMHFGSTNPGVDELLQGVLNCPGLERRRLVVVGQRVADGRRSRARRNDRGRPEPSFDGLSPLSSAVAARERAPRPRSASARPGPRDRRSRPGAECRTVRSAISSPWKSSVEHDVARLGGRVGAAADSRRPRSRTGPRRRGLRRTSAWHPSRPRSCSSGGR